MTSSHDALYRAICAHPDEDTPRLAFADLVEEAGDELRARFIRTQVALARLPKYDAEWVKARLSEPDAVVGGWGMAHTLPQMPGGFRWQRFEFRRGFPWKVGVLWLDPLVDAGEAVFEAAPIQALAVDARHRPDLGVLAEWPHLAKLHKLEFSAGWFGAGEIARLADSQFAQYVTDLAFEFDGISPDGLTALASSELLARLTALELRSNNMAPALVVDSLGAAREPGSLTKLSLPYNGLGPDDAGHLFSLPVMRGLCELDLGDNRLGVEGVAALADSGLLRNVRILNLSGTRPGVPGVKALADASGLAGLRMLDLSYNGLGPVAVKALANCDRLRGLRVLNLTNNLVGDAGAAALAVSRSLAGLLELDLRDSDVRDAGALALADSPHLDNLLRLDLRTHNGRSLGDKARSALAERFGERVLV